MSQHTLSANPTHSVWDNTLPPRIHVAPGDTADIQCVDASGAQVHPGMSLADYLAIDRTRIHALTGPVYVDTAQPGDVLQIDILSIRHHGWGWTSVIEGFGLLKDHFREPYLFQWTLDADTTASLSPAIVPVRPFPGVIGVARADSGAFRTRPPGPFGGNLDVRELTAGSTLYLPVFVPGTLFSTGDGHAAQGDGEVCINGIECPLDLTLRFSLHKQHPLAGPIVESNNSVAPDSNPDSWIVLETGPDLATVAQAATLRMIDLLVAHWGFTPVHAYILCSVAMRLRLSQVVNEPIHTVSAAISKQILPPRNLFPVS
jgi:acetamidase/formamidase